MKRTAKKIIGIALCVCLMLSMAALNIPVASAAAGTVTLDFSGAVNSYGKRDILQQYVCSSGNDIKLLNGKKLYRYSISQNTFNQEYTFPNPEDINPAAEQYGSVRVYDGVQAAYVNEQTGKLYYAYDKYRMFNKREGLAVEIITYDLEQARVVSTLTVTGENLMSVGADNNGRIFLATRAQFADIGNPTALYVYSADGAELAQMTLDNPIDTFCGFAGGGRFYFAESQYTVLANNRFRVDRRLRSCVLDGSALNLGGYLCSLDYYYNQPAKVLGGSYVANFTTRLYDVQTGASAYYFAGTSASEQEFYKKHNTPNAVLDNNVLYVLRDSHYIMGYDLDSTMPVASYRTDDTVFSIIPRGSGVMALLKNGSEYSYRYIAFDDFTHPQEKALNLNESSVYQRSQAEIVQRFAQAVPSDYSARFYSERGSANSPYKEFTLTDETKENLVRAASYYRWLEGLSGFSSSDATTWSNAAKGAVLVDKSVRLTHELSHTPPRPDDMDEAFYEAGYTATSSSNIAFGFSDGQHAIIDLLRGFLNDEGYNIPGHRDTFMTRNADRFAAGYTDYGAVNTIQLSGDPNPKGYSTLGNNQPAYAWPAPGYFPEEEISTTSVWTINLNTDHVALSPKAFYVKITDVQTGETFLRDSNETGLFSTDKWGKFISFLPPEAQSYSGKQYKVEVFNLADSEGLPLTLEYTVNFFSYTDPIMIDGKTYIADEYGVLTEQLTYMLGDANEDGRVTINDVTMIQRYLSELVTLSAAGRLAADVSKDGNITIDDVTMIQRYLAKYISSFD